MPDVKWYNVQRLKSSAVNFGIGRIAVIVVVLALVVGLGISRWQLSRARAAQEKSALRASNAIAERDVSRKAVLSAADALKILGDSLQAIERLGVQRDGGGVRRDAFDRATGRTSVVRGGISVTPGAISTTTTGVVRDTADVRIAVFHVDSSGARVGPRYVADATVNVPRPPAAASLRLGVTFSPIAISPRIQCGPAVDGIRPATLAVLGPAGVALEVQPLELNVRVCNEEFGRPKGIRIPIGTVGLLAGGALVAGFVTGVLVGN